MTISETLVVFALGRLIIFLAQKAPYFKILSNQSMKFRAFFVELSECDLCLGTWVYILLSFCLHYVWFLELFYVPFLSEVLTGASMATVMWLVRLGWESQFKTYVIE